MGRALMEHGLARLEASGVHTVRLEGDPPGIPLYRSLGFVDQWESLRYRTPGFMVDGPRRVEELTDDDLAAAAELDARYFGDDRSHMLRLFFAKGRHRFCIKRDGRLAGFVMVLFIPRSRPELNDRAWPRCPATVFPAPSDCDARRDRRSWAERRCRCRRA